MSALAFAMSACFCLTLASTAARAECVDPPGQGVDWTRCYFDGRSFLEADLSNARLKDATFSRGNLSASRLTGADASRAKFIYAKLEGAVFDDARLREADFTNANLAGASLKGADLSRARMFRANLRKADLSGAIWSDGARRCAEGSIGQCR